MNFEMEKASSRTVKLVPIVGGRVDNVEVGWATVTVNVITNDNYEGRTVGYGSFIVNVFYVLYFIVVASLLAEYVASVWYTQCTNPGHYPCTRY